MPLALAARWHQVAAFCCQPQIYQPRLHGQSSSPYRPSSQHTHSTAAAASSDCAPRAMRRAPPAGRQSGGPPPRSSTPLLQSVRAKGQGQGGTLDAPLQRAARQRSMGFTGALLPSSHPKPAAHLHAACWRPGAQSPRRDPHLPAAAPACAAHAVLLPGGSVHHQQLYASSWQPASPCACGAALRGAGGALALSAAEHLLRQCVRRCTRAPHT